jgi:hypothetical protein
MLASNSAGFIVPVLFLVSGFFAFYLTVRTVRMLQNLFATWKFRSLSDDENIRTRLGFKIVLKRIYPVYGALSYNSVQYDVPPSGHLLQILNYLLLVWGLNLFIVSEEESLGNPLAVIVGITSTSVSALLSLLMHDSFVRSWNRNARREVEIKVVDNSTILDYRSKETRENDISLQLLISLVLSMMSLFSGCFFCIFSSTSSKEEILLPAVLASCISWVVDLPFRLLIAFVLQKWNLVDCYYLSFPSLFIEIDPKDVVLLRVSENFEEERNDSFPNGDSNAPFDCSQGFSPKLKNKTMVSCEIVVPRMSPVESEPEQECSEKVPSSRSLNTLASHNVNSEDENSQEHIVFNATPRPRSPIKSKFNSPAKYTSPVKMRDAKNSGFMFLYEVSMDFEPNAEMSRDYFNSDQEEKAVVKEKLNVFHDTSLEEEKDEISDYFDIKEQDWTDKKLQNINFAFDSEVKRESDIDEKIENHKNEKFENDKDEKIENDEDKKNEKYKDKKIESLDEKIESNNYEKIESKYKDENIKSDRERKTESKYKDENIKSDKDEKIDKYKDENIKSDKDEKIDKYKDENIKSDKDENIKCDKDEKIKSDRERKIENDKNEKIENDGHKKIEMFSDKKFESEDEKIESEKMTIQDLYLESKPFSIQYINPPEEPFKPTLNLVPELKLKESPTKKSEKSLKPIQVELKSGKSSKYQGENNSLIDSFDRSENFPITEDYRADHEGDGEPYATQSPKKSPHIKSLSSESNESIPPVENSSLLSLLQRFPKGKKNTSILPKHPKVPTESRTGKTLISLHRKLISFEEDQENHVPSHTQLISPLIFSGIGSFDQNPSGPVHFDEFSKITENDEVTSSNISKREEKINSKESPSEVLLMSTVKEEQDTKNDSLKALNSLNEIKNKENLDFIISSSSFASELSSSSEVKKVEKKSSRKKICVMTSNGESEETSNPECYKRYVSKSGDERRGSRPPYRPSKSNCKSKDRSSEREVLSSAEARYRPKLDCYFSTKPPAKDLVKDKKVFDKKNRKEILKNIEKLLEVKENDYDDIEIARLKAMLASRQSFKKKHVETPKDTPYNQKIQTVFSDGSTPVEEFRLDPQAAKKREERLKRISSIYTSKRVKSGKRKNKGTLSPSKSENSMKKNSLIN